jgi:hypothetical protein
MTGIGGSDPERPAEYLVVIQVLGRARGRERERMYRALDFGPADIDAAIANLERAGVLTTAGRLVKASPALARLEHLDLIAV